MEDATRAELLALTKKLLEVIRTADWDGYVALCDPELSCFEPETMGRLEKGLAFHRQFFKSGGHLRAISNRIVEPSVQMLGEDGAVVAYIREVQVRDSIGQTTAKKFTETRIWRRTAAGWRHVHFHRSVPER